MKYVLAKFKRVYFYLILNLISEQSVYQTQILSQKSYNGKFDRVKLYQYLKEQWNKTPVLKKRNPVPYSPKLNKYDFGLTEVEKVK